MTASRRRHRVLVVVTGPVTTTLVDRLLAAYRDDELVVVAPVLLGRLRFWTGDDGAARAEAAARVEAWHDALSAHGAGVRGFVASDDPLQAIEDVLALTDGDEVVVAQCDDRRQMRVLRRRASERLSVPVVDLAA